MALILPGPVRLEAGQSVEFRVTTSDSTLAAWAAAVLTIRADPLWPRVGAFNVTDLDGADLQTWGVVLSVSNYAKVAANQYTLTATRAQTALIPYGHRRCVIEVKRKDVGNDYPDVWPTWLDVVSPADPLP